MKNLLSKSFFKLAKSKIFELFKSFSVSALTALTLLLRGFKKEIKLHWVEEMQMLLYVSRQFDEGLRLWGN